MLIFNKSTPPLSNQEEQENIMKEHQRKEEYVEDQKKKRKKLAQKIFASFTLMRQKRFLLLMPFFIANGIVYAIYSPFDMVTNFLLADRPFTIQISLQYWERSGSGGPWQFLVDQVLLRRFSSADLSSILAVKY